MHSVMVTFPEMRKTREAKDMGIKSSIFRWLLGIENLVLRRQLNLWVWDSVQTGRREVWCHGSQENSIFCVSNAVNKSGNSSGDISLIIVLNNMGLKCCFPVSVAWWP